MYFDRGHWVATYVRKTIISVVKNTSRKLVLKLRFEDEKTLGINKKITNGLMIPPVK